MLKYGKFKFDYWVYFVSIQPVDLDLSGVGSIGEEVAISSRVAADHTDEIEKIGR